MPKMVNNPLSSAPCQNTYTHTHAHMHEFQAPANASVVHWAGRLLAFTEGGSLPYELNKLTLETVGQYDVAGTMADIGRLVGGYKIAPAPSPPLARSSAAAAVSGDGGGRRSQRLVLMGAAQSGLDALLRWVEVDEDGRPVGPPTTYRMTGATALGLQDFWVTDQYYVVVQVPLKFNPERFAAEATLGMASFAECFEWDGATPSRIHLVPRPSAAPACPPSASSASPSATAAAAIHRNSRLGRSTGHSRAIGIGVSGAPFVWPPPGPEAIVVDAPPLLPVSCVGCYNLSRQDGRLLVLDAICQQGLSGPGDGSLDNLDPEQHRRQPKPELTRLVVDLSTKSASTRVLSQRTATAATTAVTFATGGGDSAATAAPSSPATIGHGGSFAGGYPHLYAAASARDAAEGWAPPQVLVKLTLPPESAVPTTRAAAAVETAAGDLRKGNTSSSGGLARWRGASAEVWYPGDRVFVGPPVFISRKASGTTGQIQSAAGDGGADASAVSTADGTAAAAAAAAAAELGRRLVSTSQLPSRGPEAEAAAVGLRDDEQEGWLLVMVHDAEAMTAALCVLDARDVTRGPVAVVHLPHHLPHARGAHFTRSYCGPGLAAPPGWRPRTALAAPSKDPAGLERTNQR
ncbi:hypothetical protein Vafri_358 [Volvox africanus]|nr:hypothetical protein Vafri_358 [Volvox africanus]